MRYIASHRMNTATSPVRRDHFARIKPNQILCAITRCGNAVTVVPHRFLGSSTPAKLAYCEHHAKKLAEDLRMGMPD
jgi:hypothetical protein